MVAEAARTAAAVATEAAAGNQFSSGVVIFFFPREGPVVLDRPTGPFFCVIVERVTA